MICMEISKFIRKHRDKIYAFSFGFGFVPMEWLRKKLYDDLPDQDGISSDNPNPYSDKSDSTRIED